MDVVLAGRRHAERPLTLPFRAVLQCLHGRQPCLQLMAACLAKDGAKGASICALTRATWMGTLEPAKAMSLRHCWPR